MQRVSRGQFAHLLAVLFVLLCAGAHGVEPAARGTLSSHTTEVGAAVNYELSVTGSFDEEKAPVPDVDGVEVRGSSVQSQTIIAFGRGGKPTSDHTIITYTLVPTREGTFTIPPLEVEVDGRKLATKALTLTVTPAQKAAGAGDLAFAELRVGNKNPYLGEAVLLELRLYTDENSARWDLRQAPVFSGSGFTVQPFGRGTERRVEMAGKNYTLRSFRALITPGKGGKIMVGPLPIKIIYSRISDRPQRDRFGRVVWGLGPAQELEVVAPAVEIDARLLPSEGRPADFSGAIGKFQLEGAGTTPKVNVGEPVQMVLRISGEGNFDRIGTPNLQDPAGWRVYDAEQKFEASDDLGYSGAKTFTMPVAPTKKTGTMPVFSFTFFDPEAGRYHTLKTASSPLTVVGEDLPPPAAAAPSAGATTPPETPTAPPPPAAPQDILGILPSLGPAWAPAGLAFSPRVLATLLFVPVPVLAFAVWLQRRRGDTSARRRQEWKRERAAALVTARQTSDPAELYDAAARVLQIDAALASGQEPRVLEMREILAARRLPNDTASAVEALFDSRAALVYAGGARGNGSVREPERDRILETLSAYERSEPR